MGSLLRTELPGRDSSCEVLPATRDPAASGSLSSAPQPCFHEPILPFLAATRAVRWCSHRNSFEMKLMGCLCSSFINYRLLSLRQIQISSGICVTDLAGPHLLPVARVAGGRPSTPAFSRHLQVSSRSSRKEICSLRESILSSCWREWDRRLMGSAPTSSGGMKL